MWYLRTLVGFMKFIVTKPLDNVLSKPLFEWQSLIFVFCQNIKWYNKYIQSSSFAQNFMFYMNYEHYFRPNRPK